MSSRYKPEEVYVKNEPDDNPENQAEVSAANNPLQQPEDNTDIFTCMQCSRKFQNEYYLQYHITHTHEKPDEIYQFTCTICSKKFKKLNYFNRHIGRHSREIVCDFCDERFKDDERLVVHRKKHIGTFSCIHCDFTENIFEICKHLQKHAEEKKEFACMLCSEVYRSIWVFKTHMEKVHKIDMREYKYTCKYCDKKFNVLKSFEEHQNSHVQKISCEICGKLFKTPLHAHLHKLKTHANEAKQRNFGLKCGTCGEVFEDEELLNAHAEVHKEEEKLYDCDECGKCFERKVGLVNHKRLHVREKQRFCAECDCSFESDKAFKKHMKKKHDALKE